MSEPAFTIKSTNNLLTDGFLIVGIPAIVTILAILTKSFWGDEILSITYASASGLETFRLLAGDFHPPLYFLLLKLWIGIAGTGEIGLRIFQCLNGTAFLATSLWLFRFLFPGRVYHPFWMLLAISPELWLFLPMVRYYVFAAALVMFSMRVFIQWVESPTPRGLSMLVFTWIALLYTDYPASVTIALQGILLLISHRRLFLRYCGGAIAAGVVFVPWAVITIGQITKLRAVGQTADLNSSPFALALKFCYSLYAFTMGETGYPFELICGGAFLVFVVVIVVGTLRSKAWRDTGVWQFAICLIGSVLFTSLITTFVSTHTSFIYTPARTLFALAFFYVVLAKVHDRLESHLLRRVLIGVMIVSSLYGCVNWVLNRHFLMPVYATPWHEVMSDLQGKEGVLYADESLCYEYYRDHLGGNFPLLENPYTMNGESVDPLSLPHSPQVTNVYLILMGRESTESTIPAAITDGLASEGVLRSEKKYLIIDESYRNFKAKILHRDSYDAKVTVRQYSLLPDPFH